MAQSIGTVLIDVQANTQKLVEGFNKAEQKVNSSISTMKTSVVALTSAYLSFEAITGSGKQFLQQAEALTNANSRLKLVTSSTQELLNVQKQLFEISNKSKTGYLETIDLFTSIKNSSKEYNIEQSKILTITEAITKSTILSGQSSAATQAALTQLGQAFNSNFQSVGQELGSLREQAPRLYKAMVEGMGVSSAKFKKMAEDGELSTEMIVEALLKASRTIDTEFGSITATAGHALTTLSNEYLKVVGSLDSKFQISNSAIESLNLITSAISKISNSLEDLSSEEIENITAYVKNMGIALVGSYTALKTIQGAYSVYNNILESNNKVNKLNIDIENAKTKAIVLGEQAVKARKLADEAKNTAQVSGLLLAENHYKALNKEAIALETAAKKQQAYSYQLEATRKGFNLAAVGANVLRGALTTIPFMAISMGIGAIATSLLTASNASETLESTIKSTSEELSKLTKNQLEYRKSLVETELIQARLDLANAKAKASNGSLKDKSYADEMSLKFEELTKTSRNVKQALDDIGKAKLDLDSKTTSAKQKPIVRDDTAIIKLMGNELAKFNLEIDDNVKKLKEAGATEAEINKYKIEALKDFKDKNKKEVNELNKAYVDISQIGMSEYDKSLVEITEKTKSWLEAGVRTNDALIAQSKLIDELNNKKAIDTAKEDLSFYERLVQLKSDSYEKEIELANISFSQKALDIQGLDKPIEDKQKLLELETQIYNKTLDRLSVENQINALDEASSYYQDMLESQIELLDATGDWNSNLTGTAASLADIASATGKLSKLNLTNLAAENKLNTKYAKDKLKYADNENKLKELDIKYSKDKATLEQKNINATLLGYSNIAGALSSMYDEGSKEAAAFQIAQSSLALVEGTRAILTAGTGDPYTAIPRMIAVGAMVSSLLSNIGIAFGGTSGSSEAPEYTNPNWNNGTGTVLGDSEAQSNSIKNSLDILEDFAKPQFQVLTSMDRYLANISNALSGVSKLMIRNEEFALGGGFTPYDSGWQNNFKYNEKFDNMLHKVALGEIGLVEKLPGFLNLSSIMSGLVNKIAGSLFGKTSVSQTLTDSGIQFHAQSLAAALDGISASAYQTVLTTVSKKSLFKKSTSHSYATYFQSLENETTRQFTLVLNNLYDTVLTAGVALDSLEEDTAKKLSNFVVNLGAVSLKGLSSAQIQEKITAVFSSLGDNMASHAFPLLTDFQAIGEGMFETLTRVATGMEEAGYYIDRLGNKYQDLKYTDIENKQGNVGFEALLQSIAKVEEATYPLNNNLFKIIANLNSTAEELYGAYSILDELRDRLIYLNHETQGLSYSMIKGASSVEALQSGFNDFFDNFLSEDEQLTYNTQQLIEKFNALNLALPTSKEGFRELLDSIDLTTDSGQELYGRLIILSQSFADITDKTSESIEELNNLSFDSFVSSIDKVSDTLKSLKDTALSFINSFNTTDNTKENLIAYNKKRAEFDSYFLNDGTLKQNVDYEKVKSLYSEISNVSKTLAASDNYLKDSLIDVFSKDINNFDLTQDVLKVKIVDGLGDLLSLNFEQVLALKDIFQSNTISKAELEKLGLEKNQLDKILEYINGSSIVSNDESLEKDRLSKQTLSYNDYVGKQEQVDIVKLLGVSYNTAKPLIQNLQNLSEIDSTKMFSYISDLVGFKTGQDFYDLTAFSQIESLMPYLSVDLTKTLENIKKQALNNSKLKINSYDVGSVNIEYDQLAQIHKGETIIPRSFSDGLRDGALSLGDNSSIVKEIKNLIDISIQGFTEFRKLRKEVEDIRVAL